MAIYQWPADDRPREKLIRDGADNLSDAELLAVLLRSGVSGKDAVSIARELIVHFGGLRGVLDCDYRQFCARPGAGPVGYATLAAALEVARRYTYHALERAGPLQSPQDASDYVIARMKAYRREVFACLFLDTRHRVIAFRELFWGTLDSAMVHPREIVAACLEVNGAALILAHNHPSGVAEPSSADAAITQRIVRAVEVIDVRVLDHLVVGDNQVVSLAERGLIA